MAGLIPPEGEQPGVVEGLGQGETQGGQDHAGHAQSLEHRRSAVQLPGHLLRWRHGEHVGRLFERQRRCLIMYYGEGLNMREIGELMGIDKSTVSRNIKRGESRLRRCLRYGAEQLLAGRD